jgi:hypothetical protein
MAKRKPTGKPTATSTNPPANPPSSTAPTTLPPFSSAPPALLPLLTTLPQGHIYLTTLDTTTPTIKRNAFLVPVLLNLLLTLGLLYRLYTTLPTYLYLIVTVFGHDSPTTVDTANTPTMDLLSTVSSRTFIFMLDYAIFTIIGAWPWQFLFGSPEGGHVGPATWRWSVGAFKPVEVVVRRSRKWDKNVFGETAVEEKSKSRKLKKQKTPEAIIKPLTMSEILAAKIKITPAMSTQYLSKTGYAMLDRDWDLDFAGMVNAFQLLSDPSSPLSHSDLQNKAFIYNFQSQTWLMWSVHPPSFSPFPNTTTTPTSSDPTIEAFRSKLTAMSHEDLFYRWIELVQYESSVPGGMTEAGKLKVLHEARKMFEEQGVDFDKFFNDVGGEEGMPGLVQGEGV